MGQKITWRGFGREWSGVATGRTFEDGLYTEVNLDPDSRDWGPDRDDRSVGAVLTQIIQIAA